MGTSDARRALLAGLIDHAALFPPASLPLEEALAEHARVCRAEESWLVARFVCPASRLRELGEADVRLTVVLDDPAASLDDPRIEAVEVPPSQPADAAVAVGEVYVERPIDDPGWLDAVAAVGRRAKVRCGGAVVPSVAELAAFVRRCRALGIPFKATAGLHHAVAAPGRHGFLNLLAAAAFREQEEDALSETDASAFALDRATFSWRGRVARRDELAQIRRGLFVGFGSCSVDEPVDDLRALGML